MGGWRKVAKRWRKKIQCCESFVCAGETPPPPPHTDRFKWLHKLACFYEGQDEIELLLQYYYALLHFLLLLIITKSLLRIITSLLQYYYIVITPLLFHYYQWEIM